MASCLTFFLVFLMLTACIRRSANTVVKRSSLCSTGTSVWLHSFWVNAFTFSACSPRLPSMECGRPTTIFPTCCWVIISVIASISRLSSLRLIIVNGLANMPSGSLRATPILLSPMSSPRLRVIIPPNSISGSLQAEGLHLISPYLYPPPGLNLIYPHHSPQSP